MILNTLSIGSWFEELKQEFITTFIVDNRYQRFLLGLKNTLIITAGALVIGIVIGVLVASIRTSFDKNKESMKLRGGPGYYILGFFNAICKIYLTVVRGTPVVVQLFIAYFILLVSVDNDITVGVLAFGINSGAYVAEIVRAGIMSIDEGQFEAGRSLGLNYFQTMRFIIIPQMFKAVLPTLCNEFIALLKETSVSGYIGITELTRAGNEVASVTFSYIVPYFTVALVYLVIVMILSWLVGKLERRLRKSDR